MHHQQLVQAGAHQRSAADAAIAEAMQESGVCLPHTAFERLRCSLAARILSAGPRALTTARTHCRQCGAELEKPSLHRGRDPRVVAWIYAEPEAFQLVHVPRLCRACPVECQWTDGKGVRHQTSRSLRYWCGFLEQPIADEPRTWAKIVDSDYCHADFWMLNKSVGVSVAWLRRWRYRIFVHRASFQGEARIFDLMHGPSLLRCARTNLSSAWVRFVLWRRAQDTTPDVRRSLREWLLSESVETLVAKCWHWYEPLMYRRRYEQLVHAGDRRDIVAMDGNAKLHRRTCGMPFCETIYSRELDMMLLRGCPRRPEGKGALCAIHAKAAGSAASSPEGGIRAHRLRRALHGSGDVGYLEVKLHGYSDRWQPACTVAENDLAAYFAQKASERIQERRLKRLQLRAGGVAAKRQRREASFMSSWSSTGPRAGSDCSTHKETSLLQRALLGFLQLSVHLGSSWMLTS